MWKVKKSCPIHCKSLSSVPSHQIPTRFLSVNYLTFKFLVLSPPIFNLHFNYFDALCYLLSACYKQTWARFLIKYQRLLKVLEKKCFRSFLSRFFVERGNGSRQTKNGCSNLVPTPMGLLMEWQFGCNSTIY